MTTILEENDTNWLIMTPDGSTETKTKSSNLNKLLYSHDLSGLLEYGTEIWQKKSKDSERTMTIIPGDGESYTLKFGNGEPVEIGAHHKTDLIDALAELYEDRNGRGVMPLVKLYDRIRNNRIRSEVVSPFADVFTGKVAEREDGWFINGHLLLTYEREFYHPSTDSRERSGGSVVGLGSAEEAYNINVKNITSSMYREVTVDGEKKRLKDDEMVFLAMAMWAIENTPDLQ